MNEVYTDDLIYNDKDKGVGIPPSYDIDPMEIVREYLPKNLDDHSKKLFLDFFENHKKLICRHSFDAGCLKNAAGETIKMSVPLKCKLPYYNKFYKLKPEDQEKLSAIVDYLIHHGLAVECDVPQHFGSPVFLIERKAESRSKYQESSPRILIDTRILNKYLNSPISLLSESVFDVLLEFNSGYKWITSLDLSQAYYSVFLDEDALEAGISNIVMKDRVVKLLTCPTGTASIPLFFRKVILEQLDKNQAGQYAPLSTSRELIRVWFDDIFILTSGPLEEHIQFVCKVLARMHRTGVKLNIKKSSFCKSLENETVNVLGFQLGKQKISVATSKMNKIESFPIPKTRKELQAFLGMVNYLHALLPCSVSQMCVHLAELSSVNVEFKWNELYEASFNAIKDAIVKEEAWIYMPPPRNVISYLYSDASLSMYGSFLCYLETEGSDDKISERKFTGYEKIENQNLQKLYGSIYFVQGKGKNIGEQLENLSFAAFSIFSCKTPSRKENELDFISFMKHTVNNNLRKLYTTLSLTQNEIDELVKDLSEKRFNSKIFTNPAYFGLLFSIVSGRNTIMLTQTEDKFKLINQTLLYNQKLAPITFLYSNSQIQLLLFENDFQVNDILFGNHKDISIQESEDPQSLYNHLCKLLKSKSYNTRLRIGGHFSKSVSKEERKLPMWQLEALGILHSLTHFKHAISHARLSILLCDSVAAFYIFNKKVQDSVKKIMRFSLKLSLEFPNTRVLCIAGKSNIADYFSRLGLTKREFFRNSLTPVSVDYKMFGEIYYDEDKLLTWTEIAEICDKNPGMINFADKKLDMKDKMPFLKNRNMPKHLVTKQNAPVKSVHTKKLPFRIFDNFLSRESIIDLQRKEFAVEELLSQQNFSEINGVLTFNNQIMLPSELYGVAYLREHFLGCHLGTLVAKSTIQKLYHIADIELLKNIIYDLSQRCLVCLVLKAKNTKKLIEQYFPLTSPKDLIQIDYVDVPSGHLLVIVNCFSKFVSVYIHHAKTVQNVILALSNYYGTFGTTTYRCSDNGPEFRSNKFQNWLKFYGIKKLTSNQYSSKSRSIVEIFNRYVQQAISTFTFPDDQQSWKNYVPIAVYLMNQKQNIHGQSPFSLQFGVDHPPDLKNRPDMLRSLDAQIDLTDYVKKTQTQEVFREKIVQLIDIQNAKKDQLTEKRNQPKQDVSLDIGQFVLIKNRQIVLGTSKKLSHKYEIIPYKITAKTKAGYYATNIVTKSLVLRHFDDLKIIKISQNTNSDLNVPTEIAEILYSIELSQLNENFQILSKSVNVKRKTRQQTTEQEKTESLLQNDLFNFVHDIENEEFVSFAS